MCSSKGADNMNGRQFNEFWWKKLIDPGDGLAVIEQRLSGKTFQKIEKKKTMYGVV